MRCWILTFLMFPFAIFANNIEGTWDIKGNDPYENKPYSGTAVIKADKNGIYQITWTFDDGSQYQGTGLLQNNELSAVFNIKNGKNESHVGLQIYAVKQNTLEGSWVLLNRNLIGNEILTKK